MTRRRLRGGYTIVELLMSITVLGIGVSGIIAMQKVTVASNQHAKNLAVATHIAEAWADQLHADAAAWNHPSPTNPLSDLDADTIWLKLANSDEFLWKRPDWYSPRLFGPGFGPLGNPVQDLTLAEFCTDIRLTWLNEEVTPDGIVGMGLIRAEVRVFWKRENEAADDQPAAVLCSVGNTPTFVNNNPSAYHFVHFTTAISQQSGNVQ